MNPLAFYQSCLQNWVNTVERAQANMLAFHQAVATIQGYRARALGQWWQQAPAHLSAILAAPTPAEAAANLTLWQGTTAIQATALANDTHAARAHLLKAWSRTFAPAGNPGNKPAAASATVPAPRQAAPTLAATPAATAVPAAAKPAGTTAAKTPAKASKKKTAQNDDEPAAEQPRPQQTQTQQTQPQPAQPAETATVVKLDPQPAPQQAGRQTQAAAPAQPAAQPATAAAPIVVNGNAAPAHSPTATTFARNTGHALSASAAPRRTASIPARAGRSRPR